MSALGFEGFIVYVVLWVWVVHGSGCGVDVGARFVYVMVVLQVVLASLSRCVYNGMILVSYVVLNVVIFEALSCTFHA